MTKEEIIAKSEAIGGLSTHEEKEALWELSQKYIREGGLAIEVGTWTGGSAVIIGEVCAQKGARLICIDSFSTDMHGLGNGVMASPLESVINNTKGLPIDFMAGDSTIFVNYLKSEIADLVFIDGDHHYPRVELDIRGYISTVRKEGMYCGHDYTNPCDVKAVIDEFLPGKFTLYGSIWAYEIPINN